MPFELPETLQPFLLPLLIVMSAAFDINIACAGFVYALDVARALVAQRPGSLALVIGADLYSRFLDYGDRGTAVLLGDAAYGSVG